MQEGDETSHPQTGDYITLQDFMSIVKKSELVVGESSIIEAFAASKMTFMHEADYKASNAQMKKLVYGEFLEAICRVTLAVYEGSEF